MGPKNIPLKENPEFPLAKELALIKSAPKTTSSERGLPIPAS